LGRKISGQNIFKNHFIYFCQVDTLTMHIKF
jgi:hypothetical protein